MNEALIKRVIKLKLNAAETLANQLPREISKEFKDFSRIVLEAVNESYQEFKEKPKSLNSNKLNNISIE